MCNNSGGNLSVVERDLPFDLPSLRLNGGGEAALDRDPEKTFSFTYHAISFTVRLRTVDETGAVVEVTGDVGPMPFSAESAAARAGLTAVLDAANSHLGEKFHVSAGRIRLVGQLPVTSPVTSVQLVTALAQFLIPAKPYLATIGVFLAPAGAGNNEGDAALRPIWRRRGLPRHTAAHG